MTSHLPGPYEHMGNGYIMGPSQSVVPWSDTLDNAREKTATFNLLAAAPIMLNALQNGATKEGRAIKSQRVLELAAEALRLEGYEALAGEVDALAQIQARAINTALATAREVQS